MARKAHVESTTNISDFVKSVAQKDRSAAMAFFLLEETGSIFGCWSGRMKAETQRALFGRNIGRGRLTVNGATEMVSMYITVCFGMDFSCEFDQPWYAIDAGVLSQESHLEHMAQPYRYGRT